MGIGEELLEPVRLWSAEAEEHRGISEFQAEVVQPGITVANRELISLIRLVS